MTFNKARRYDVPIEFYEYGIKTVDELILFIRRGNFKDDWIYGHLYRDKKVLHSLETDILFSYGYDLAYDSCGIQTHYIDSIFVAINDYIKSLECKQLLTTQLYDEQYVTLQSTGPISRYKFTGGLQLTEDPEWVDTTNRPGRGATLPGTQFGLFSGTAHYWFGGMTFDNYIPKDRILAFTDAEEVTELPNGIVYVHLYKNMFKGHEPEAQRRQLAFRKHLGLV